ncbi:hypothetical protein [Aquisphaera insulae]|uniref:hypothetical protein n=1 Tax=Aquisphaera insulae TaxID=2712864 RepID=UPI0013EE1F73|nr:hypothetical protein [Aquisphaera insulae]
MTWNDRRGSRWLVPLAALAALGMLPSRAHAQFGMGFGGMGWGIGFNYVPSPTNLINENAMSRAGRAQAPESRNIYAGNPNAYINNLRDNSFVPSYSVSRRRPTTERAPSRPSPGDQAVALAGTPNPAPAAPVRPQIPLASFFDATRRLVWPEESPVDGDLKPKRDVSDQASLQVFLQTLAHGTATLTSVADARQKLLDYGRPALKEVREKSTPRVADTFHMFMLSLYDSLGQVATVADPSTGGPPPIP